MLRVAQRSTLVGPSQRCKITLFISLPQSVEGTEYVVMECIVLEGGDDVQEFLRVWRASREKIVQVANE